MSDQCFTLPFWAGLDDVINQYIDSVTLEQLAQSLPAVKEGWKAAAAAPSPDFSTPGLTPRPKKKVYYLSITAGVFAQIIQARLLWEQEAASSSLATPI